jgi:hypothetical protein
MTGMIGPADRIPEDDLLRRLLANYGVDARDDGDRARFVEQHLASLERVDNEVIARSGAVLRKVRDGYGLGYKVPLALMAAGQALLGIDFAISAPFIASNPAALTCAAIGAIYYGYNALSEEERQQLNARIGAAFDFGVELVRNLIQFCIEALKAALDSDAFKVMKDMVAQRFGLTIADITRSIRDRVYTIASTSMENAAWAASTAAGSISQIAGNINDVRGRLLGGKGGDKG